MKDTTRGFTLIEIMLVVLLMSIVLALVAPLGIKQVEKARAQTEWLTLDRELGRLSLNAFLTSEFISLYAAGKQLAWEADGGAQGAIEFEHLFFSPEQRLTINPNGIANPMEITIIQRERQRTLSLAPKVRE